VEKGVAVFAAVFKAQHDEIFRDATQRVSASIVRENPVDTGESVADWDVAIGTWPADTKPPNDPRRTRTRKRLREIISKARFGQAVFFENTDPAAVELEFGWSRQAPNGMVRLTARRWNKFVKGAVRAASNRYKKMTIDG
jgi:hypothetical protein